MRLENLLVTLIFNEINLLKNKITLLADRFVVFVWSFDRWWCKYRHFFLIRMQFAFFGISYTLMIVCSTLVCVSLDLISASLFLSLLRDIQLIIGFGHFQSYQKLFNITHTKKIEKKNSLNLFAKRCLTPQKTTKWNCKKKII